MKVSQKRAIFYHERERKLKKLEEMGLIKEYEEFIKDKKYHMIEVFCRHKGIRL